MNIKICGIKKLENAQAVIDAGADHIGFIFFERSPRNITPEDAGKIADEIRGKIKIAAVVVNASDECLAEIIKYLKPDYIQLHGAETADRARAIKNKFKTKIIKAISVEKKEDLKKAEEYKDIADYIMFDAKPPKNSQLPGGNAVSFDWNILKGFSPDYKWILSGGLNAENIRQALEITGAEFVDVSSGVEKSAGEKDNFLIKKFVNEIKH